MNRVAPTPMHTPAIIFINFGKNGYFSYSIEICEIPIPSNIIAMYCIIFVLFLFMYFSLLHQSATKRK